MPAGAGFATLRACFKLWLGFPPQKSGVFSAGNGPAMRSPIIGVAYGDDIKKMKEMVKASTFITHTDPKAFKGAMAAAIAAHLSAKGMDKNVLGDAFIKLFTKTVKDEDGELSELLKEALKSAQAEEPAQKFADSINNEKGISGYIYKTVPAVIQTWLRHPEDYKTALVEIIGCGGDTDTAAAILGGIVGAGTGAKGIPQEWIDHLWEWPKDVDYIKRVGERTAKAVEEGIPAKPPGYAWYLTPFRNFVFMVTVLLHGLRRLFPPY